MTYTKEQKKEYRKRVYDIACGGARYFSGYNKKELGTDYDEGSYYYLRLNADFYQCIKKAEYMMSLKLHKKLNEIEEKVLDEMVFNAEENELNSEDVRKGSARTKKYHNARKDMLYSAMSCDARVGYWKLSK